MLLLIAIVVWKTFCIQQIKQLKYLPITLTQANIPTIQLINLCSDPLQLILILDTGSSQLWLADNSCSQCKKTLPICPHITIIKKTLSYIIGEVKGDYSYLKICQIRQKILCIKEGSQISSFNSNGILGLSGNSTGIQFINELMLLGKYIEKWGFYYGKYEKKLIFGDIPSKYISGDPIIFKEKSLNNQWIIKLKQIHYSIQIYNTSIQGYLDSGSSVITLPKPIFRSLLQNHQSIISQKCIPTFQGIKCPNYLSSQYDQLIFQLTDYQNRKLILPTTSLIFLSKQGYLILPIIQSAQNYIILGTPFLNLYLLQLDFKQREWSLYLNNREQLHKKQSLNLILVFGMFCIMVLTVSFAFVKVIDTFHTKASNKIII